MNPDPRSRATATKIHRRLIKLHGQRIAYLEAGSGPPVLLIHGIAEASWVWEAILPTLAQNYHVIAPDLLGHGKSAKPRGDYSLGSQASLMRDLLDVLDIDSATLVGHSLGGGITMQFAYQYPERCERMVLVASGGLGNDVTFLLRSLRLPGANLIAPLVLSARVGNWARDAGGWLGRHGLKAGPAQSALWRSFETLTDPDTRRAFIATVAAVVDQKGQRVSAMERLYLARSVPTLILWGDSDRIIPVSHAHAAHRAMTGSRLEIVERAGHFLPVERPSLVSAYIAHFMTSTDPAQLNRQVLREAMRAGAPRRGPRATQAPADMSAATGTDVRNC